MGQRPAEKAVDLLNAESFKQQYTRNYLCKFADSRNASLRGE